MHTQTEPHASSGHPTTVVPVHPEEVIPVAIEPQRKPPREKKSSAPKHVPPGRVPQLGPRGIFWKFIGAKLYSRFGWGRLLRLSMRERYVLALDDLWEKRHVQKIITAVNSKGGSGKTPTAVWLSAFYALAIKRHIVAFDANENTGQTAKRFGIDRKDTIQLRELLRRREEFTTLESFMKVVAWHRETGVSVIASEAANNEPFSVDDFMAALAIVKRNAHSVFCDCGNGIPHPANLGSVIMADVLLFPGKASSDDALDDISFTQTQFAALGYPEKVKNGIVVIIGASPKRHQEFVDRYGYPPERVFVIPHNNYMSHDKPVAIDKIPLKVQVAFLEILVAIVKAERGHDNPSSIDLPT